MFKIVWKNIPTTRILVSPLNLLGSLHFSRYDFQLLWLSLFFLYLPHLQVIPSIQQTPWTLTISPFPTEHKECKAEYKKILFFNEPHPESTGCMIMPIS